MHCILLHLIHQNNFFGDAVLAVYTQHVVITVVFLLCNFIYLHFNQECMITTE